MLGFLSEAFTKRNTEITMGNLTIKPAESCKYDLVSLGEIMLRLDPGEGRVRTTRTFDVWEGGGEYNLSLIHI